MNETIITKLENKLIDIFGEKATLAMTTARVNRKGYMTRIGAQGLPFEVSAFDKNLENSQTLAFKEFEKQLEIALREKILPSQPSDKYVELELTFEDIYRLFGHEKEFGYPQLKDLEKMTRAKICHLDDGKYECIIKSSYMNINIKNTGSTLEDAIDQTIYSVYKVLFPESRKVGDLSIER